MHLLIPKRIVNRLKSDLRRAGHREIGGLLLGEHVNEGTFRVADITVQRSGGNVVCFVRKPSEHKAALNSFFERTENDYKRFNYLGEWHSHPSFEALPSRTDIETMNDLLADHSVGANFLVMIITKLTADGSLELGASLFVPHREFEKVTLQIEDSPIEESTPSGLCGWVRRLFRR